MKDSMLDEAKRHDDVNAHDGQLANHHASGMNRIPYEVFTNIAGHGTDKDRITLRHVSRTFQLRIDEHDKMLLNNYHMQDRRRVVQQFYSRDEERRLIESLERLKVFDVPPITLENFDETKQQLQTLCEFKRTFSSKGHEGKADQAISPPVIYITIPYSIAQEPTNADKFIDLLKMALASKYFTIRFNIHLQGLRRILHHPHQRSEVFTAEEGKNLFENSVESLVVDITHYKCGAQDATFCRTLVVEEFPYTEDEVISQSFAHITSHFSHITKLVCLQTISSSTFESTVTSLRHLTNVYARIVFRGQKRLRIGDAQSIRSLELLLCDDCEITSLVLPKYLTFLAISGCGRENTVSLGERKVQMRLLPYLKHISFTYIHLKVNISKDQPETLLSLFPEQLRSLNCRHCFIDGTIGHLEPTLVCLDLTGCKFEEERHRFNGTALRFFAGPIERNAAFPSRHLRVLKLTDHDYFSKQVGSLTDFRGLDELELELAFLTETALEQLVKTKGSHSAHGHKERRPSSGILSILPGNLTVLCLRYNHRLQGTPAFQDLQRLIALRLVHFDHHIQPENLPHSLEILALPQTLIQPQRALLREADRHRAIDIVPDHHSQDTLWLSMPSHASHTSDCKSFVAIFTSDQDQTQDETQTQAEMHAGTLKLVRAIQTASWLNQALDRLYAKWSA